MKPGGHTLRSAVVLALLAAGATVASASKLDKTACAELSTEFAGVTAAGVKGDMERGPEWAKANLSPERLASIHRLIEVQEQLEFRCGIRGGGKRSPGKPEAPGGKDDTPGVKVEAPADEAVGAPTNAKPDGKAGGAVTLPSPEKRLQAAPVAPKSAITPVVTAVPAAAPPTSPPAVNVTTAKPILQAPTVVAYPPAAAISPTPRDPPAASALGDPPVTKFAPLVPAVVPAAVTPAATNPATGAPVMAANPPVALPPAGPPVTKLAPLSPAPAGQAALPAPAKPGAPALKKAADPAAQALGAAAMRKKPSRRDSSNAYVAPDEVSPYSLSRYGSER